MATETGSRPSAWRLSLGAAGSRKRSSAQDFGFHSGPFWLNHSEASARRLGCVPMKRSENKESWCRLFERGLLGAAFATYSAREMFCPFRQPQVRALKHRIEFPLDKCRSKESCRGVCRGRLPRTCQPPSNAKRVPSSPTAAQSKVPGQTTCVHQHSDSSREM